MQKCTFFGLFEFMPQFGHFDSIIRECVKCGVKSAFVSIQSSKVSKFPHFQILISSSNVFVSIYLVKTRHTSVADKIVNC